MVILLKPIYRFNAIPIRIPGHFFAEISKIILKFKWSYNGTRQHDSEKNKNKTPPTKPPKLGTQISQFQNLLQINSNQDRLVHHKDKYTDQ
jgi:hypothetical protein